MAANYLLMLIGDTGPEMMVKFIAVPGLPSVLLSPFTKGTTMLKERLAVQPILVQHQ